MSGATDSGMVRIMGIVMGCLAVLAVVCAFAARSLSSGSDDYADPLKRNALIERIQPVGAVRTSADDLPAATTETAMADSAPRTGEELANGACAGCHISGAAGAPKFGDEQAWAERREAGLDALVASVINGKGSMPARGASDYSDEEIKLAVEHMALFDEASAAAPEAQSSDSGAADTQTAAADSVSAAGTTAMAALVVGQVPDGVTDDIKAAVDGVCAGCHLAGVAGAPKNGDKAAWQERADKGLEALTASVINGLNVMPARGGSTLSDADIPIAIQYLMSK